MNRETLPTSSAVPRLPSLSPQSASAVAEILVDERLGCLAPAGFFVILLVGMFMAGSPELGLTPKNVGAYTAALVLSGLGFIVAPVLVGRWRVRAKLTALGLSREEIAQVRRETRDVRDRIGGAPREDAVAALSKVLTGQADIDAS